MPITSANRNLLMGILALQMDFISQQDLIDAMQAWMLNKDRTLDEVLVQQGKLSRNNRILLAQLVERHLDEPAEDEQMPANNQAISHLLSSAEGEARDTDATRAPTVDTQESTQTRYRTLRPYAQGGLGEISIARDQELGREVALKQLRNKHADNPDSRARFVFEAEVTGNLEHPGVVPVHGLGRYPDGRPYYAMRFIRGDTMEQAITRFRENDQRDWHGLEMRHLLSSFLDVCQTVAYAHSRGVIHRDLKPANIILGQYDETLLVDWGMAKLLDQPDDSESNEPPISPSGSSGSGETLPGAAVGTPSYMSPEQAAGRQDKVGTASDVYSLGATLYCLLTGKPPFATSETTSLGELLQKVERGDFPPPRKQVSKVPRALQAICLKAMAKNPKDRYPSVLELAQDIERWLADEPVSAYREPWKDQLMRFARQHRAWVMVGAGVLVAILATSTLASVWLFGLAEDRQQMHKRSMHTSATFAARTMANELDLRWRTLKAASADEHFQNLLSQLAEIPRKELADDPDIDALHDWLKRHYQANQKAVPAVSWIVLDHRGRLLARHPALDRKKMGLPLAYRDYFHGQGRNLPPEENSGTGSDSTVEPIQAPSLSTVFRSKETHRLHVAFSVPVQKEESSLAPLGVLVMTVELGSFRTLDLANSRDKVITLIDTRKDQLEGEEKRGLILHHPGFAQLPPEQRPIFRVSPEQLADFNNLSVGKSEQENREKEVNMNYHDPVGDRVESYTGVWMAASAPIVTQGRQEKVKETGWAIIVQDRNESNLLP